MSRYPLFTPRFRLTFMAGNVQFAFPYKLHALIDDAEKDGRDDIVSWIQDGKAFQIHKQREFTKLLLPKHFHSIKYRSFQRQLHLYGFRLLKKRSHTGAVTLRGAYAHELFQKGNAELCQHMVRRKMKGDSRSKNEDSQERKGDDKTELKRDQTSSYLTNALVLDRSTENTTNFEVMNDQDSSQNHSRTVAEIGRRKHRLDKMLDFFGGSDQSGKEAGDACFVGLRDGDAALFEGKQFHFMEYDTGDDPLRSISTN